jgi:hypothetical protein
MLNRNIFSEKKLLSIILKEKSQLSNERTYNNLAPVLVALIDKYTDHYKYKLVINHAGPDHVA